ncbi:MAG: hypothetical protein EOP04_21015 [Proteobacteria bacterium]|nr:MAG: hypothetical protein EOP04_21015 [Pseudomonadota bacterium]
MEAIETSDNVMDTLDVTISYRAIELFSAGPYSFPNNASEELVCSSFDAFAYFVSVTSLLT